MNVDSGGFQYGEIVTRYIVGVAGQTPRGDFIFSVYQVRMFLFFDKVPYQPARGRQPRITRSDVIHTVALAR